MAAKPRAAKSVPPAAAEPAPTRRRAPAKAKQPPLAAAKPAAPRAVGKRAPRKAAPAAPDGAKLRAVQPGERAPSSTTRRRSSTRHKTVTQAASSGTTRELLVATRDRIAVAVENPNTPARDLAALTKRLMETVREIEAIDARGKSEEDEKRARVEDEGFDAAAI